MERSIGEPVRDAIATERIFTIDDFTSSHNAWQRTALSLAHTLMQTAVLRPSHRSREVQGLWYTGMYTHPGIGVPMALISSHVVADEIGSPKR